MLQMPPYWRKSKLYCITEKRYMNGFSKIFTAITFTIMGISFAAISCNIAKSAIILGISVSAAISFVKGANHNGKKTL